jgi:hypothetical protein
VWSAAARRRFPPSLPELGSASVIQRMWQVRFPYRPKTSAGAAPLRPRTVASIFVFLFAGVAHPAVFQGAGFDLTYNVRDYL